MSEDTASGTNRPHQASRPSCFGFIDRPSRADPLGICQYGRKGEGRSDDPEVGPIFELVHELPEDSLEPSDPGNVVFSVAHTLDRVVVEQDGDQARQLTIELIDDIEVAPELGIADGTLGIELEELVTQLDVGAERFEFEFRPKPFEILSSFFDLLNCERVGGRGLI